MGTRAEDREGRTQTRFPGTEGDGVQRQRNP